MNVQTANVNCDSVTNVSEAVCRGMDRTRGVTAIWYTSGYVRLAVGPKTTCDGVAGIAIS
jgi:hypothetical protein